MDPNQKYWCSPISLNSYYSVWILWLHILFCVTLATSCQKTSVSASATGGGGGGSNTSGSEIEYEVSGTITDEEPLDFVESQASVEISGVNLTPSTKFKISAFYLGPTGKKTLFYEGESENNKFTFASKVPKHLLIVEAIRASDGGRFAGLLPPPMRKLLAKLRINRTTTIAAKMANIIAEKAATGDVAAQSALTTNSISVADVIVVAQTVLRTVDEQKNQNTGSAIDLNALATNIVAKTSARFAALTAAGQSPESLATKISDKNYESIFSVDAETASPAVLAHRTNLDLGPSVAATRDVAYEAIKSITTQNGRLLDEAYRIEATVTREASSVAAAEASESQIVSQFANKFTACQTNPSSCASTAYTPPPPPSSSASEGGGVSLPVITVTAQPSSQTAANGTASFSVTATVTNGATLSYQWQKQESGSGSFNNVSGQTASTLTLSGLTNAADNTDVYRVVVSATGGASSVTSTHATLTVDPCAANGWCVGEGTYYINGQPTTLNLSGSGTWNGQSYTNGVLTSQPSTAACASDCYAEGVHPQYAQGLNVGTERLGPDGATMSLQFANGVDGFKIWKEKNGSRILNSTGLVAKGWQKLLTRRGDDFSSADFTTGSNIVGRVCPTHVFLNYSNMTGLNRCLYFDGGNSIQSLATAPGFIGEDRLVSWNDGDSGRGVSSSYYEGNIKTCADKGMRIPTLYETNIYETTAKAFTAGSPGEYLPTGDSISPAWAESLGVPTNTMAWTATAHASGTNYMWNWVSSSGGNSANTDTISVICVVPSHSLVIEPPPPPPDPPGGGGDGGSGGGGGSEPQWCVHRTILYASAYSETRTGADPCIELCGAPMTNNSCSCWEPNTSGNAWSVEPGACSN